MSDRMKVRGTFRSLQVYNYRLWAMGAIVSNIGTWMQRTAQDWLVLAELTNKNATSLGIVMALQFGPQLLFLPITGLASDRLNRRKLLMVTQACMGLLALALGLLTITGVVRLWHVYIFAFLLGTVTAFDTTARQTFVAELVGDDDLPNAVALNSTSFNIARMIGPAVAGLVIAAVGSGWGFLANAASFVAVLVSLMLLRRSELYPTLKAAAGRQGIGEGFRYVWTRPDLMAILTMLFLIGTFGINFPIFISTMSIGVFHKGAQQYGILTSMMAIGSVTGALLSARRENPGITILLAAAILFGIGFTLAAFMPDYWLFGMMLSLIGVASQTFTTTANSTMQLSTDPVMRGRVMALFFAIALGSTPLGAPLVGWVADHYGPRWAQGIGAFGGFSAALVAVHYLIKHRNLHISKWRLRYTTNSIQEPLS